MARDETSRAKARKQKLEEAIKIAGSAAKLSKLCGISASEISQMRNPDHPRNVGDVAAEKIETALSLPHGWMDYLHTANPVDDIYSNAIIQLRYAGYDVKEDCNVSVDGKKFKFDIRASYGGHDVYIRIGVVASIVSDVLANIEEAVSKGIDALMVSVDEANNVASFVSQHFAEKGYKTPTKNDYRAINISALLNVATPTYMDTLLQIQKAKDAGVLEESDKAMLKIIADKYRDKLKWSNKGHFCQYELLMLFHQSEQQQN